MKTSLSSIVWNFIHLEIFNIFSGLLLTIVKKYTNLFLNNTDYVYVVVGLNILNSPWDSEWDYEWRRVENPMTKKETRIVKGKENSLV